MSISTRGARGGRRGVVRITANLTVADIPSAAPFYRDVLGLSEVEFDLGWGTRRHGGEHRSPRTVTDQPIPVAAVTSRQRAARTSG